MSLISRRSLIVAAAASLAGCSSQRQHRMYVALPWIDPAFAAMYGPMPNERFPLPAVDLSEVDPRFLRQEVEYSTREPVGTLVVDTPERHLYLVRERGRALRYGVGVGRAGFQYRGAATVARKAAWPRWTPTANMIRLNPEKNAPWANGMEPGIENPLGARALYLYNNGVDTMYRIHGTNEPWSIGQNVSSGCIRMFNQDVIDLYERIPLGTRVVVRQASAVARVG
jgi:lipoprotein-anchoring transpeptidase ErfK/SrfK